MKTEFYKLKKETKQLRRLKSKPITWNKENKERYLKKNRLNSLKKIIFELYTKSNSISSIRKHLKSNYELDVERQLLTSWLKSTFDIEIKNKEYTKRKLTPKLNNKKSPSKIDPFYQEIILLYEKGCSISELTRFLNKKKIKIDRKTISRWLHKYFIIEKV